MTVDTLLGGKLRSGGSSALTSNGKLRRRNRLGPIVPRRKPLMANLAAGVQAAIQTKKEEENPVSERSSTSKDTFWRQGVLYLVRLARIGGGKPEKNQQNFCLSALPFLLSGEFPAPLDPWGDGRPLVVYLFAFLLFLGEFRKDLNFFPPLPSLSESYKRPFLLFQTVCFDDPGKEWGPIFSLGYS